MERSWYVRLGLVLAVVLGAIYLLVPTFIYFTLPQDIRNDKEAFEAELPSWAPKKRINLGLDLQGGVHLVLGVDLDKAVKDKVARRADELRTWATERKLSFQSIQANRADETVAVTFSTAANADAFAKASSEYFGDMRSSGGGNARTFAFTREALTQFRQNAVDQALRTIRNRVDKWGVSEPTIAKRGDAGILVQLPGFKDPEKAKDLLGRTAQLEFKIVADGQGADAADRLGVLPAGITRGTDGSQAYLQSDDQLALQGFVEGKAPEGFEFAIGRIETGPGQPTIYRTYTLLSKTELTGDRK